MRYFIGFLVTIGLIVLILFLIFSGGGGSTSVAKPINLEDYANNGAVRAQLIIEGPVVADQDYQELEIDVTQDQVALTVYKGYQRQIVRTQSYVNNDNAFAVFMYSLERNGYSDGLNDKALSDERGYCVQGISDIYTFNDGSNELFRYWSNTCGQGTFKGNIGTVVALFKAQVPDYDTLTSDQNL